MKDYLNERAVIKGATPMGECVNEDNQSENVNGD